MAGITYDLAAVMATVDDLDKVALAVAREQVIREGVAETGEDRQTIADLIDAHVSMGEEAVLDLMEGEPTTLAAGLRRYLDEIHARDELQPRDRIADDLETLLAYPWPGSTPEDWAATGTGNVALTQEVHATYLRLAPERGFEMVPWDRLTLAQKDLALAVMADVVRRGVVTVPGS